MAEDLAERVGGFLSNELAVRPARLALGTRLGHDLGVDGDDAVEVLERFATEFAVDLSTFDVRRHFGPEAAFNPVLYLYWRMFRPERLRFVPLTVGDVVEAARAGVLRNPVRAAV